MLNIIRLIRLPNLLIIALTLYCFRYLVALPYYSIAGTGFQMDEFSFALMVAVTMMIAVAGYLINDHYDREIDKINRPGRPSVSGNIRASSLSVMAALFSITAMTGMILLSIRMASVTPALVLFAALITVWWYAMHLKKSLLWGNLAVAFMSSLTLGMAWLFEWMLMVRAGIGSADLNAISWIALGITVFAFLLSLIREIIKDLEDLEGDRMFGCRSIPIVKGIRFTTRLVVILLLILFILLLFSQIYLIRSGMPMVAWWLVFAVDIPSGFFLYYLLHATAKQDYHKLSSLLKWIMVGGIASMAAIWLSFRF